MLFEIQADLCRVMGNPLRMQIVYLLRNCPLNVNEIASALDTCQSTVSRNMTALRNAGIVSVQRDKSNHVYSLANPSVVALCNLMREVVIDQMSARADLIGRPGQ